ncbi:MAG TPA: AmmeMemoRadiSam system radical SAM enzyme [Dehalococcoidales bacterium]
MHPALLSQKLANRQVKCNICGWRCVISPDRAGVCRMYKNVDGILYNLNYGLASSVAVDPIEKKPLFHFYPGSQVFSLGSWGCNFHCGGCQNWQISCAEIAPAGRGSEDISPARAIALTRQNHCRGIAWTYNEPAMWFEYTLDSAKLAKENNLYSVYVTNGYMTAEALDLLGPYLGAWRVDVKGFKDEFYQQLAKITHWKVILETAERAKNKWNMHVEVVTNIIPTQNDDDEQLKGIAYWIHDKLGELTPWHVTRFYPQYQETDLPATPVKTLERALEIGRQAGLRFIYVGNVPGHDGENTRCYNCRNLIVERQGYTARVIGLEGSKCKFCGAELNFRN